MQDIVIVHDSHCREYRAPFGAVPCRETIILRLTITGGTPTDIVTLRLWHDAVGESLIPMQLERTDKKTRWYSCKIEAPDEQSLMWYYFIVECAGALEYYGNNPERSGGQGSASVNLPPSFQITVHQAEAHTPAWLKDGLIYQIFIDRFYNGEPGQTILNPKKGSLIHASWDDKPFYVRDPETNRIVAYDFFGGNLRGVMAKLQYLKDLGVTIIYLNPIFESISNHRYDTGDYHKVDPMIGDNRLFAEFCAAAKEQGISVILDGVFSHTGSDSIYFNKEGAYPSIGAYQSQQSPYHKWYRFQEFPNKYESWWGIDSLPNVEELEQSYIEFMLTGKDSVVKHWLKLGAKGWRLDVVDELPEEFVKVLYKSVKEVDAEAVVLGEVWEDASNKQSYGKARHYWGGAELDSVMNYPFREIAINFLLGKKDATGTNKAIMSLYENYPKEYFYSVMNLLGTHDVPRILTLLGEAPPGEELSVCEQREYSLPPEQRRIAVARLKLATLWQMTFPGVPSVYYGDEAGLEGYRDPYNRGTYPWGKEDSELMAWHKLVMNLRRKHDALRTGEWQTVYAQGDIYAYYRRIRGGKDVFGQARQDDVMLIILNRGQQTVTLDLPVRPWLRGGAVDLLENEREYPVVDGALKLTINPLAGKLLQEREKPAFPRACGILMHPTSLPAKYGIGDLGKHCYEFINFLAKSKQKLWQVLPLNPVGYGESPYQCPSAFAGNPLLIAPGKLTSAGLLTPDELREVPDFPQNTIDYERVSVYKEGLLRKAFTRFTGQRPSDDYKVFLAENAVWLEDYALFMALKKKFGGTCWSEWPADIATRKKMAVSQWRDKLGAEIAYHKFVQYIFFSQWMDVKRYAERWRIKIIGDLPIFVAYDSADVWANPKLFKLDKTGRPSVVAGVPPDYFSPTGQLWGNPHYNWTEMAKDNFSWWCERVRLLLRMNHLIRIDHFRGFEAAWEVHAQAKTAVGGKWVNAPGAQLFAALEKELGRLPVIAEDLGVITPEVDNLKDQFQFPGMKILQFSMGRDADGKCLPVDTGSNSAVYTGTHDNETTLGWYRSIAENNPDLADCLRQSLGVTEQQVEADEKIICWRMLEQAYASAACLALIPLQDILCLGNEARMNHPGTVGNNWRWRCEPGLITSELAVKLADLAEKYKR